MRNLAFLLLALVGFAVLPAAAQDDGSPLDWVPADFEGVLQVDLSRPAETLAQLNMSYYVAAFLQPARAASTGQRGLNDYFPVDLFDTEGAAFETTVLPWLAGEFVVAYRTLDENFAVAPDDVLLVLPTDDAFAAASLLSAVTSAQDLPSRAQYGGATIFIGDQTAIAFTPGAVLVGSEPLLHAAIDAEVGASARLADTPAYAAVAAERADWPVFAYLTGDAPLDALSVLLNGDGSAQPVLSALGNALAPYNGGSLEAALLNGDLSSVAVGLEADQLRGTVRARVLLQTSGDAAPAAAGGESNVLSYIPRNAMLVQQGGDVRAALYDALVAAPAGSYFNTMLNSGLTPPGSTTSAAPTAIPPDADAIDAAVGGLMTALSTAGSFDLESDLTAHLDGGYALALLPRPNNPAPGSGAPYDVLLIAETGDAEAAVAGATTLAQTMLALDDDAFSAGDDAMRTVYGAPGSEPLLQIGAVDGKLVVGTGSAVAAALRAGSGDNQLVSVARWQAVSRDAEPTLYLDLNALFSTFRPTAGGPVNVGIGQLGANVQALGDGRYQIDVIVTLPEG